ncbi:MAG: trigger factor [Armatimonadetes bacterium]|nr:trigger factor [Armatimonadota bacterium]
MEVRYTRDSAGMATLEIDVDAERVDALYQRAVKDLRRHVNLPGFRPGRVPAKMVESIIGRDRIADYARDLCKEQLYPEALDQVPTLVALDEPEVELEDFAPGTGAKLIAKVKSAEVSLGDYQGMAVERFRVDVTTEEAQAELDRQYRQYAEYADADHEDVRDGDVAVFTLRIIRDGILVDEWTEQEPVRLNVGANQLQPNIDANLIGLMVGQDSVFDVTYPADYGNEDLAGQTVEFAVSVIAVQSREGMTEWAAKAGFESVEDAIGAVRTSIVSQRAERFRLRSREDAVLKLIESATIDYPRSEVDAAVMEEIETLEEEMRERGTADDEIDAAVEAQTAGIRERVEYERRREVALRALAQAEKIELDREDIAREISMMSTLNRVEPRLMMRRLEEEGMLGEVARNARLRKAAEWLVAQAQVTEVDPPAADAAVAPEPVATAPIVDDEPEVAEPEDEPCP